MAKAPQNPPEFTHSELATFLSDLADAANEDLKKRMLRQGASHFATLARSGPARLITVGQKEELTRLSLHPLLSRQEKTKLLMRYMLYTEDEAADRIRDLQSTLSQREDMRAAA